MSASPVPGQQDAERHESRTVTLLKEIQAGTASPQTITTADRRQLVAVLMYDGYSTPDMAQILQVSDRSIERDKQFIRQSDTLPRDPKLVEQMVGRLRTEAELSVQRMRKAVRDKDASASVKVDAEHRCYVVISDLFQNLQRVGYLPTAAQKIEAELTHAVGEIPGFDQSHAEVQRLRSIVTGSAAWDSEVDQSRALVRLSGLEQDIVQAKVAAETEVLSSEIEEQAEHGNPESE